MDPAKALITDHARNKLALRHIDALSVRRILDNPESVEQVRPGRVVFQGMTRDSTSGRQMLLRVFVDVDRTPAEVVTAYQTSKIDKYKYRSRP